MALGKCKKEQKPRVARIVKKCLCVFYSPAYLYSYLFSVIQYCFGGHFSFSFSFIRIHTIVYLNLNFCCRSHLFCFFLLHAHMQLIVVSYCCLYHVYILDFIYVRCIVYDIWLLNEHDTETDLNLYWM